MSHKIITAEMVANSVAVRRAKARDPNRIRHRFESNIAMIPIAGCWLWLGQTGTKVALKWNGVGHGKFYYAGRLDYAHRVAWKLYRGEIPSGLYVCHRCDVPSCVNPAHLFLGTQRDNVADSVMKGRTLRGEEAPNARFTEKQVIEMRRMYSQGTSQADIARMFAANPNHIGDIVRREIWKHLP